MHFPTLFLLLSSALASFAEPIPLSPTQRTCLTSDPDLLPADKLARIPINAKATIIIDVIFHVIRASPTVGNPPRSALDAQVRLSSPGSVTSRHSLLPPPALTLLTP